MLGLGLRFKLGEGEELASGSLAAASLAPGVAAGAGGTPGVPRHQRVIVIGAGASGLVVAKHLLDFGHEVMIRDREPQKNYHPCKIPI